MGSERTAARSAEPYAIAPSWTWSSTPVTVTVCGAFQSAAVKVRLAGATAPSPTLLEATGMTTSAVGWLFKTTDRKGVAQGKRVDLGGRRIIKKKDTSLSGLDSERSAGAIAA